MVEERQDEVSLVDLWKVLVAQRKTVFLSWLAIMLLVVFYLVWVTPIYKAESFFLPPSPKGVQPLNISLLFSRGDSRGDFQVSYTPDQVYTEFLRSLRSRSERQGFYDEHEIAQALGFIPGDDAPRFFEDVFNKHMLVNENVKKNELQDFVSLSFEGKDANKITQWVNEFVSQVAQHTAIRLASDVMAQVEALVQETQDMIDSKLALAKVRRQDRMAALQEAMQVAVKMSQGDQSIKSRLAHGDIAVNTEEVPLYMLSPNVLKAEMQVLQQRKDDAPFVDGLRDLQEKLSLLKQVRVDPQDIQVMTWDQKATVPNEAEKPKTALVVILGALLGLMLGIMFAFLRNAFQQVKHD